MLPKQLIFNIFTFVEGTGPANTMVLKNHVQKDNTWYSYSGQFIEHAGAEVLPNMFGAWKHVVWSYNATNSTYSMFIDGIKLNLPQH
jgi:hypothetical protein